MAPVTNAQAVSSAVASLILFSMTLCAGYALAADGIAVPVPVAKATAAPDRASTVAAARDELRITALHGRLGLTPAQEPLWDVVAGVMRSNDREISTLTAARRDGAATRTAIADLVSSGEIAEAHAAGIRAFSPAFETLYDTMSAAQKANADAVFRSDDRKSHGNGT